MTECVPSRPTQSLRDDFIAGMLPVSSRQKRPFVLFPQVEPGRYVERYPFPLPPSSIPLSHF
jgi:hypothetical protein